MEPGHVQHQFAGPAGIAVPLEFRVHLIADVAVIVCVEIVPDADADFSNGGAVRQDIVIVEGEQYPIALRLFPDAQGEPAAAQAVKAAVELKTHPAHPLTRTAIRAASMN